MKHKPLRSLTKDELYNRYKFRCSHSHTGLEHETCYLKSLQEKEIIGFFDIEATNLKADFGFILTYAIKIEGGGVIKRSITPKDIFSGQYDKNICRQFLQDVQQFDRLITYYGSRFDIPYIRTRCLRWGLGFPAYGDRFHTDAYDVVKHRLKLHRSRLETASQFLNIPSKQHRLNPEVWQGCQAGNKKNIDYVVKHNVEDVISLEKLWMKIQSFTKIKKTSL